jgi:hypothetical protein
MQIKKIRQTKFKLEIMSKRNFIAILCVIALASCQGQEKSNRQEIETNDKQSVSEDIRTDTADIWNSFHEVRQLASQLNLGLVEDGFDSLQIRVWFDYSMAKKRHLIIIQRKNNRWSGYLYDMNVRAVDTLNYHVLVDYSKKDIEPLSGWENLISNLNLLKIQELSDTSQSGTDGTTYCVEILTSNKYTYYNFWEPEYTKDIKWASANMVRIRALLEREFSFNSLKSAGAKK